MLNESGSTPQDPNAAPWSCTGNCGKSRPGTEQRDVFHRYLRLQWNRGFCPDREQDSFLWRYVECSLRLHEGFAGHGRVDPGQDAIDDPSVPKREEPDYPEGYCPPEGRIVEPWEFTDS